MSSNASGINSEGQLLTNEILGHDSLTLVLCGGAIETQPQKNQVVETICTICIFVTETNLGMY